MYAVYVKWQLKTTGAVRESFYHLGAVTGQEEQVTSDDLTLCARVAKQLRSSGEYIDARAVELIPAKKKKQ